MAIEIPLSIGEVIVGGDKYVATLTIQKDGSTFNLSGYTTTATIKLASDTSKTVDATVALVTEASGIVSLTLTPTQTAALLPSVNFPDYAKLMDCIGDAKVTLDSDPTGDVVHSQALRFDLRRPVTS